MALLQWCLIKEIAIILMMLRTCPPYKECRREGGEQEKESQPYTEGLLSKRDEKDDNINEAPEKKEKARQLKSIILSIHHAR